MPTSLDQRIKHVIVLMLENRSFDSMLGNLYPKTAAFDGLSGLEINVDNAGQAVSIWNLPGWDRATMSIPSIDPGELWFDMNTQIFGSPVVAPNVQATMSGFVQNYLHPTQPSAGTCAGKDVMHFFTPEQVPVLSRLARQFAVSDRWHASAPCQTWPSRFFAHTGAANGYENNSPAHFPYEMPTIFNRLDAFQVPNSWKIYFHDVPQSLTLAKLWPHLDRFRLFSEFLQDASQGRLPAYSFLEPRYFSDVSLPNDQHPPHVVTLGEQLISDVYKAVRNGPSWTESLLIITYDEHGGCYDHVPPPLAKSPSPIVTSPFNFDRYGVRVPAVLVSPYIKQGTVLRPSEGSPPFDHTSIIKTLRTLFSLGPALSDREGVAPDVLSALTLAAPDNLGPDHVDSLPYAPSPFEMATAREYPLNDMQEALVTLSAHLPAFRTQGAGFSSFVDSHIQHLKEAAETIVVPVHQTAGSAEQFVKNSLGAFFRSM